MTTSPGDGYSTHAGIFIKPHSVDAPHETATMESQEIMDLLHSLDPGGTWEAGHHFAEVGLALNRIATRLAKHAEHISGHWKGKGATRSIRQLKEMHDYVAELAAQANQTGEAMKWLGNDVMPHYKSLTAPHKIPGVSKEQANHAARSYLESFSSHVVTANNHIPPRIVGMNPAKTAKAPPSPPPAPAPTPTPTPTPTPSPVHPSPPATPVTTAPPGGHLQSVTSPFAPSASAPAAPAAPSTPAAPFGGPGFVPAMPGAGGSALGDTPIPVSSGASEAGAADGAANGAAGDAAGDAAATGAEAAGGEEGGMAAMPMMGGAGGQSGQDRQRDAWMNEDKEIWGAPSDDGPPAELT